MNDLSEKTILVTGASSGIGLATVKRLASTGATVVAHYNSNRAGAEEAITDFAPGRAFLVDADLGVADGANRLWERAVATVGHIDVLVLNAGIMPKAALDTPEAEWAAAAEAAFQVNALSPLALMRQALGHYLARGGGTIVSIGSWVTQRGSSSSDLTLYAASKAATAAALKTVARAYADRGVLIYQIAPGAVNTEMTTVLAAEGDVTPILNDLAMHELVPPAEIAELAAMLSSGRIRHLSGATLDINGASYVR